MPREFVSRREKKTLQGVRLRSDVADERSVASGGEKLFATADALALHFVGDVVHRPAFWHSDRANENLAVRNFPEYFARIHGVVEEVFAGLKLPAMMPFAEKSEGQLIADDVVSGQNFGDAHSGRAVGNIHKNLIGAVAPIGTAELGFKPSGPAPRAAMKSKASRPRRPTRIIGCTSLSWLANLPGFGGGALALMFEVVPQQHRGSEIVNRLAFSACVASR